MKYIEHENAWKACMEAVDELDLSKIQIPCEENCEAENLISNEDNVVNQIKNLATYSYDTDVESGKISQRKLLQMERDEKIISSHIFRRMARCFYLQEKLTNMDYSRQRTLCCTIHNYLGNTYYFSLKEEVKKRY